MAIYYLDGKVLNETDYVIKAGTNYTIGTLIKYLEKKLEYDYESKTTFTKEYYQKIHIK